MIAVFAGSFCPPTLGHLDIIKRASELFDGVVVAILSQRAKSYLFSTEERLEMMKSITAELRNVRVVADDGLLVDVVQREGADVILRGLRDAQDLPFELQIAEANRRIAGVETVYMSSLPEYNWISSTIVRDCASHGAPIGAMVPRELMSRIYAAYGKDVCAERMD